MTVKARLAYRKFIDLCRAPEGQFQMTPHTSSSEYALCFAIFGYHLLSDSKEIDVNREKWNALLRQGLLQMHEKRGGMAILSQDKPYLQLLVFTLSALSILGTLKHDPLPDVIIPLIPTDLDLALRRAGVVGGLPRSGNYAMFMGILLLHARDYLGLNTHSEIDLWLRLHIGAMNDFGFWGRSRTMSHLQFQNGYHQYELLKYMQANAVPWDRAANAVASLADAKGHFAPHPGGTGCYDYDAVFVITTTQESTRRHRELLARTAQSILSEQNIDGGFCESLCIRPRSMRNISKSISHSLAVSGQARIERIRSALTLLRPKYDRIHTHWSEESYDWNSSDLWNSWFRMLTLARIETASDPALSTRWGFINYPGIGYHHSLRAEG
jgi:hypothetical protein